MNRGGFLRCLSAAAVVSVVAGGVLVGVAVPAGAQGPSTTTVAPASWSVTLGSGTTTNGNGQDPDTSFCEFPTAAPGDYGPSSSEAANPLIQTDPVTDPTPASECYPGSPSNPYVVSPANQAASWAQPLAGTSWVSANPDGLSGGTGTAAYCPTTPSISPPVAPRTCNFYVYDAAFTLPSALESCPVLQLNISGNMLADNQAGLFLNTHPLVSQPGASDTWDGENPPASNFETPFSFNVDPPLGDFAFGATNTLDFVVWDSTGPNTGLDYQAVVSEIGCGTSSIPLGTSATVTATVTGNGNSGSPTGTVSFFECGPTAAAEPCTSQADPLGSPVPVAAGSDDTATAVSAAVTPGSAGWWCFAADYSGDANYAASEDTTTAGCILVTTGAMTTLVPLSSSVILGDPASASALVAGTATDGSPTGTVSFYACGPTASAEPCTSQADSVGSPVALVAGADNTATTASPGSFTPDSTGWWCFAAYYSGDSNYPPNADTTADGCELVLGDQASTIVTSPSVAVTTVPAEDTDQATVTGNATYGSPTGTVQFYSCGPSATPQPCTSQADPVGPPDPLTSGPDDTATVTSGYTTADSPGWWCFAGDYSGDFNYRSSADTSIDGCFDARTPPPVTTAPTSPSVDLGAPDADAVTVSGNPTDGSPTGTVSFYECGPSSTPGPCTSQADPVGSPVTLTPGDDGTSTATSPSVTPGSTGWWCMGVDYSGDGTFYAPSQDVSGDGCFLVTLGAAATVSAAPQSPGPVAPGGQEADQATVTGTATYGSPTGTVSFYECGPSQEPEGCSSAGTAVGGPVTVTPGPDDTATATSPSYTLSGAGYYCLAAVYSGDSNYGPAADTTTDQCVFSGGATTTTVSLSSSSIWLGESFEASVTVAGDGAYVPSGTVSFYECGPSAHAEPCTSQADPLGGPVTLAAGAAQTATAAVSVTPTGYGHWCVAAYYSGDSNYESSSDTHDTCVDVPEGYAITSAGSDTVLQGQSFNLPVTTAGPPPVVLKEAGRLPSGVAFNRGHDGTGSVSGTPALHSAGVHAVTIQATFGSGRSAVTVTQTFTLTVDEVPEITSGTTVSVLPGRTFTFSVRTAYGYPIPSISDTTLPAGVTLTDNHNGTATITGSLATAGSYPSTIDATNAAGTATQTFTVRIT